MRSHDIEDLFIDELLRERFGPARDNTWNRISSTGDPDCKIYCRRTGAHTVPSTAHQMYTFQTGHVMHEAWQKLAHRIGLSEAEPYMDANGNVGFRGLAEVKVSDPEFKAMGHFDLLTAPLGRRDDKVRPGVGVMHYVLDFKTISDLPRIYVRKQARAPFRMDDGTMTSSYWKRVRFNNLDGDTNWWPDDDDYAHSQWAADAAGWTTNAPVRVEPGEFTKLVNMKDEHRMQATQYAYAINTHGLPEGVWPKGWDHAEIRDGRVWPKVNGIILVYLAKDRSPQDYPDPHDERNCPIKVFAEPLDETVIAGIQEKLVRVNAAVEAREMPPKLTNADGGPAHFPCAYCEFRHHCWPENFDRFGRSLRKKRRQQKANV